MTVLLMLLVPHAALATAGGSLVDRVAVLELAVASLQTTVSNLQSRLTTANAKIARLQGKPAYVSIETGSINGLVAPRVIFTGANVRIRSGSGGTDDSGTPIGLGNLIVGYNEEPLDLASGDRSGFHNLIVGPQHGYLSTGGLVAGQNNTISGLSASVSGGLR